MNLYNRLRSEIVSVKIKVEQFVSLTTGLILQQPTANRLYNPVVQPCCTTMLPVVQPCCTTVQPCCTTRLHRVNTALGTHVRCTNCQYFVRITWHPAQWRGQFGESRGWAGSSHMCTTRMSVRPPSIGHRCGMFTTDKWTCGPTTQLRGKHERF